MLKIALVMMALLSLSLSTVYCTESGLYAPYSNQVLNRLYSLQTVH